jgi:hypothetical protein
VFGNYAIRGIQELIAPGPVSWFPATVGWKVLGLFVALLVFYALYRRYRHWRANRYRREALAVLEEIRALPPGAALAHTAALIKSTALAAVPRTEIASLSGERWVRWLQASSDDSLFSAGSYSLLASGQYRAGENIATDELNCLLQECAHWIRKHRSVAHD